METALKCWTAPGVVFETRAELHEHYKSEWHKYNLKRKVANLPPVPAVMFEKLQRIQAERENAKSMQTKGTSHIKRSKRAGSASEPVATEAPAPPSGPAGPVASKEAVAGDALDGDEEEDEMHEPIGDEEDAGPRGDYEVDEEEMKREVDFRVCFLDGHASESFEENLLYMKKYFGFYVPDVEFCSNLPGMFKYCTKKVLAGKLCLTCERPFKSKQATLQHMIDKSHCKIPWEFEDDVEEYEEFYDYSALAEEEAGEAGEAAKADMSATLLETGELELLNRTTGERRIVGHRAFLTDYKQRVRPEETRPAVLANSKERLLLMYQRAGVETSSALARPMYNGGRPAWMNKKLAREQTRAVFAAKREDLRNGMAINLLTKHRQHMKKQLGAGFGVHG